MSDETDVLLEGLREMCVSLRSEMLKADEVVTELDMLYMRSYCLYNRALSDVSEKEDTRKAEKATYLFYHWKWLAGAEDGKKVDVDTFGFMELGFTRHEFIGFLGSFCKKEREYSRILYGDNIKDSLDRPV